jgi:hypothetical protein
MKNIWLRLALGAVIVTGGVFTTACGKRGKGGGGTTTAAVPGIGIGGIGVDQYGNPIIPGGGAGYIEQRRFFSKARVQDPQAYREMLSFLGLCWNTPIAAMPNNFGRWYDRPNRVVSCGVVSNLVFMSIDLQSESLPNPSRLSLRASVNGRWRRERHLSGEAYALGSNSGNTVATGFVFVHNLLSNQNPILGSGFGAYQQPPIAGQNNTIQVIANIRPDRQFADFQLLFRGRPVMAGVLQTNTLNNAFCGDDSSPCQAHPASLIDTPASQENSYYF